MGDRDYPQHDDHPQFKEVESRFCIVGILRDLPDQKTQSQFFLVPSFIDWLMVAAKENRVRGNTSGKFDCVLLLCHCPV